MGIVVRNGIIYISYAEELRREHGHTLKRRDLGRPTQNATGFPHRGGCGGRRDP